MKRNILSVETILSACPPPPPRAHTHARTHARARTHTCEHTDYTKLNLNSKRAANRLETDEGSTERKTWQVCSFWREKKFLGYTLMSPERASVG